MRIAVFVLAIVGGIVGIFGTLGGLSLTALGSSLSESAGDAAGQQQMTELGALVFLGFVAGIVTIVAGAAVFARKAPRAWGIVLIAANVVGTIAAGGFYMFGGVLGILAGILALFVRREAYAVE